MKSGAQSGAVTLIQRSGSALNLNLHFHMLHLGGVYDSNGYFWPVKPPTKEDLDYITHTIAKRVSRYLKRSGYRYRDAESEYLDLVACKSNQRKKIERLCRYITRPAFAEQRLSLASNGNVIVALKTPYDDGTSQVVLNSIEFMGRLAVLAWSAGSEAEGEPHEVSWRVLSGRPFAAEQIESACRTRKARRRIGAGRAIREEQSHRENTEAPGCWMRHRIRLNCSDTC